MVEVVFRAEVKCLAVKEIELSRHTSLQNPSRVSSLLSSWPQLRLEKLGLEEGAAVFGPVVFVSGRPPCLSLRK